jgi:hypothetical protein
VLFVTFSVPAAISTAPPSSEAELPEKVLLVTVSAPSFQMPPPRLVALLSEKVVLVTLRVPPL